MGVLTYYFAPMAFIY
jgi:hypothetical protein